MSIIKSDFDYESMNRMRAERARESARLMRSLIEMADRGEDPSGHETWDEFCRVAPVGVASEMRTKAAANAERIARQKLIDDCLAPCPDDKNPAAWYAERSVRLLAAIFQKLHN